MVLDIAYIIPISEGGTNHISNLITVCREELPRFTFINVLKEEEQAGETVYERKSIPLKIREEIFKRDSYSCQYCGRKESSEVKLEIEHIIPVAKGGDNDITNFLTACEECNAGKSDTLLNDNTFIESQYREIMNQIENIKKIKEMHMLKLQYEKNKDIECKILEEVFYIRKILINKFNIRNNITKNQLLNYIKNKIVSENYDTDMLTRCAKDCWKLEQFFKLVEGNKPKDQAS